MWCPRNIRLTAELTYIQAETFSAPNAQQQAKGAQSIASYHGTSGPVQATYPDLMYGGPQQPAFINTVVNLTGINHYKDINGGTPNAVSITPLVSFPISMRTTISSRKLVSQLA